MKNPAYFKGTNKKRKYFEGWYFKCITADRKNALAFIPGIAIDPSGLKHSFIQIIDAVKGKTWYHHFPYDSFVSHNDRFDITIDNNHFDSTGLSLNILQNDFPSLTGEIGFSNIKEYPVSNLSPGIMGPFSFIPFMECYHAIIHLSHDLNGKVYLEGETIDFSGGTGYIEKDYGRSFPQSYIWIQASHFKKTDASFVFSRAHIPFFGSSFPGFFAYFTDFIDNTVKFATYNHSRLIDWDINNDEYKCQGELTGPNGTLIFKAQMSGGGILRAPVDGLMNREIVESITAIVDVKLYSKNEELLFSDTSGTAGMEICLKDRYLDTI